jgi:hypothetical protein
MSVMNIYTPELKYYVYAYLRESDGSPYYIGKGQGNRHLSKKHTVNIPKNKSLIVILEQNLTEVGAFALERKYIKWYGRKDNNTGLLWNRTDGGEGTSGFKIPCTEKRRLSISISKKGIPMSEQHKTNKSKSYIVTSPNGEIFNIRNLNQFCKNYSLRQGSMTCVAQGLYKSHKGWLCSYV